MSSSLSALSSDLLCLINILSRIFLTQLVFLVGGMFRDVPYSTILVRTLSNWFLVGGNVQALSPARSREQAGISRGEIVL